jgi:dihydroneopterin aldolase
MNSILALISANVRLAENLAKEVTGPSMADFVLLKAFEISYKKYISVVAATYAQLDKI